MEIQRAAISPASMATCVLLVAAVAPLYVIEVPAMVDYLNHLARMELLSAEAAHPAYAVAWRIQPNSTMDLIVPPLGRLWGVEGVLRAFLGLALVLIVSGAVAVERAVKGRHEFAGLCALAVLFSLPLTWGMVNFTLGLGIALWGVAVWVWLRPSGGARLWLAHSAIVLALFVSHFFALGLYGLAIGLIELSAVVAGRARFSAAIGLSLMMAAPVAVLLAMLAVSGGAIGTPDFPTWDFGLKGYWLLMFMNTYDRLAAVAMAVAGLVLVIWLALSRRVRLTSAGAFIAIGLAVLYAAMPVALFGIAYLDVRLLTFAALILPPFLTAAPGRWRFAAGAVLASIAVVNGAVALKTWRDRQPDYAEIRESFAMLPPGSAVLIVMQDRLLLSDQPLLYAPTLAVPEAKAFVSAFYGAPSGFPIEAKKPYDRLAITRPIQYVPPTLSALKDWRSLPPQLRTWARDFQYVYVIGRPSGATPAPHLLPIRLGERFGLYQIGPRTPAG